MKKIEIKETTKGDKTYYNISPKKQLDAGEFIVVKKIFEEGREMETQYGKVWSVTVNYLDKDVGMFMTPKEYSEFNEVANVDDSVKLTYTSKVASFRKDGKVQERKYLGLKIEKYDD